MRTTPGYAEAEAYLLGLELFGMRFGTERMRRLTDALGRPQERFASIHVVGSNGKSSTARLTAAILQREGLRTGTYLSPHLVSFTERVRVDDEDLEEDAFAAAVARVHAAADELDRAAEPDDHVTQFEALTAAAFVALAGAGVDVAVVEAGLGGRYDATNVIPSRVTVLTGISLEHTRWLGDSMAAIAGEKVDVLQPQTALVLGAGLAPEALAVAERVAGARGAAVVHAAPALDLPLRAGGSFQPANLATAAAGAAAFLGRPPDPDALRAAAARTLVPGRFETISEGPLTIFDGAHNPAGTAVLAESIRAIAAGRRVVVVLSILDDKDAATMLTHLGEVADDLVLTGSANPRAADPAALAAHVAAASRAEVVADPHDALATAKAAAGPGGIVVATGSLYLLADLLRPAGDRAVSVL